MLALIVVLEWAMVSLVLGTTISAPTTRTCGDPILTCTFIEPYDASESRLWRKSTTSLVTDGLSVDAAKYVETFPTDSSATSFTLTIKGFGLADVGDYSCSYAGSGQSQPVHMPYTCYDNTSFVAVCTNNKITITVDQVYPDIPTTTLSVTDSDGTAVTGTTTSENSTAHSGHFTLTWTSTNAHYGGYAVGISTSAGSAVASLATGATLTCEPKEDGGGLPVVAIVSIVLGSVGGVTGIIIIGVCVHKKAKARKSNNRRW